MEWDKAGAALLALCLLHQGCRNAGLVDLRCYSRVKGKRGKHPYAFKGLGHEAVEAERHSPNNSLTQE
jgi:hypothetical protein